MKPATKALKSTEPPSVQILAGVKVRCENCRLSHKLQLLLAKEIGCSWGAGISTPWNTRRQFLMVLKFNGGWFFAWATKEDFEKSSLPEWSAQSLIDARPRHAAACA